jgi:hypothetical protein
VAKIHRMPECPWQCLNFLGTGQVITTGAEIMGEVFFGLGRLDLCISPEPLTSRMRRRSYRP